MKKNRVVITGMGAVTSLGLHIKDIWNQILSGQSGVSRITHFDASSMPSQISASIHHFEFHSKDAKRMDVFMQYAVYAAREAILDAGLSKEQIATDLCPHRIGVAIGSGIGGLSNIEQTSITLHQHGPKKVSPFFIPSSIINLIPGYVSTEYGLRGPSFSVVTACATGAHNIGLGMRMIQHGEVDMMIVGGSEMATTPSGVAGFSALRALSTRNDQPACASRPWDRARDGFVMADGAGILVIESLQHAQERGARIYAELSGFGYTSDAYHITAPEPQGLGAAAAMQQALQDADLAPEQIQYINAHGTSTHLGDIAEIRAIKHAMGSHAYHVPVSSTKSMTGHLIGAAGSVEAIFCALSIRDQMIPPTINLEDPDDECDLDFVPAWSRPTAIQNIMSNSFGFGGTNVSLVFSQLDAAV